MNNRMPYAAQLLLLTALCFALNACAPPMRAGPAGNLPPAQAAQRSAEQGQYARAAQLYEQAARLQQTPQQQDVMRLEGAIAALHADRLRMAQRLLTAINPQQLDPDDYQRYQLAQILVHIADMPPEKALKKLPPPPGSIPPNLAALIWKTRAELFFAQYQYVKGIHSLIQRSVWLLNEQAVRQNNKLIFQRALEAVKLGRGPDTPAARSAGATALGWLRLAQIKLHGPKPGPALQRTLNNWENRFTGHPATGGLLERVFNYQPYSSPLPRPRTANGLEPGPIVLFLPLSGKLSKPAHALRAGFEVARADSFTKRPLKVIDSTGMSAREILQRARSANAALIVGPLKKSKVASLARLAPRIPVLALNQMEGLTAPPWFYRYALAPEDDARTAAAYAAAQGWDRALALVPQSGWGLRVLQAFRNAFSQRGGRVVAYARFDTSRYDHQRAVKSVLQTPGTGEPADFLFMAARPVHARLLHSQLRYFHAARLPVIATSDVYSGQPKPRKDIDLNGVAFAAVPWVVNAGSKLQYLRHQAKARPGHAAQQFPRLFAMGVDAWRLAQRFARRGLEAGMTLQGLTGVLEVLPGGRIRRHLAWAHFVAGRVQLIAPASANGPIASNFGTPFTQPPVELETPASRPPQKPLRDTAQRQGMTPSGSTQRYNVPQAESANRPSPAYGPVYSTEPVNNDSGFSGGGQPQAGPQPQPNRQTSYGPVYSAESANSNSGFSGGGQSQATPQPQPLSQPAGVPRYGPVYSGD